MGCIFTLDGASDFGVRRTDHTGNFLPYVARYNDGGNSYLNFLNLKFPDLISEVIWLFPPKSQETIFLQYYLSFKKRPRLILLLLQHQALPSVYNFALDACERHLCFPDQNYLAKSVKSRQARVAHPFKGLLHIFDFKKVAF